MASAPQHKNRRPDISPQELESRRSLGYQSISSFAHFRNTMYMVIDGAIGFYLNQELCIYVVYSCPCRKVEYGE
jgi:hypothetical protein